MTTRTASPVRARILDAAVERYYLDGIRATSADRLIADAGVSKATFYRHYPTKGDLVVAYLEQQMRLERTMVEEQRALHPDDPAVVLRWYAGALGTLTCSEGFRGCPFLNAAVELSDPFHPGRRVVEAHRAWLTGTAAELLVALGVADADAKAAQLVMLRDGAMVAAHAGGRPEDTAAHLVAAGRAVITRSARRPGTEG